MPGASTFPFGPPRKTFPSPSYGYFSVLTPVLGHSPINIISTLNFGPFSIIGVTAGDSEWVPWLVVGG